MKIVAGGGIKKSEILGGPVEGRSRRRVVQGKGGPAEGCPAEGVHRRGGPAEGSIGNGVQGSGFRVQFRFFGTKTDIEQKQNEE